MLDGHFLRDQLDYRGIHLELVEVERHTHRHRVPVADDPGAGDGRAGGRIDDDAPRLAAEAEAGVELRFFVGESLPKILVKRDGDR